MSDMTTQSYPDAERTDLVEQLPAPDGPHTVADPYRWLEDAASPATTAWADAQDGLYQAFRATWDGGETVRARLGELLSAGFIGPPVWRDHRCFFMRRSGDQEHAVLVLREGEDERILLDPMEINADGTTTLDAWQPSKDGTLLAYQLSEGGTEESTLYVMDVATGERVDGPIDRGRYSPVAWLPDSQSFLYVRRLAPDLVPDGEEQFHRRVYWHALGADPDTDIEVFGEGQPITNYYGATVSLDGRWLVVTCSQGTDPRTDVVIAELASQSPHVPEWKTVISGVDARTGGSVDRDGKLWLATDKDAPRGMLVVADPTSPEPESWRTVIAERDDAVLEDYALVDTADGMELLVAWSQHAVGVVTRHNADTGEQLGTIDLPGVGSVGGLITKPTGGADVWFVYTDFMTNPRVLQYTATTGNVSVYADPPGAPTFPAMHTEQVEFESKDGTTVRMFVVSRATDVRSDGTPVEVLPTVLYGYGGFGHTMSPGFSAGILAWVERGGRYAIAGLRGGSEEGETWHRDGMLGNKQNVYDDFLAAADTLVDRGYTSRRHLAISGGSNGGLLVGAAVTQAPEKFAAVVCSAPLLDMVRYQLHGLGETWSGEYGDANKADELAWLHAYSPYHRVSDGSMYPATLFEVFEGDTRVDPLHARKMCAAMQHATAAPLVDHPVLIRAERNVGHGARSLSRSLDMLTDSLVFMGAYTGWSVST